MMQRWSVAGSHKNDEGPWVKYDDALVEIKSAEERGYAKAITYSGLDAARDAIRAEGAKAEQKRIKEVWARKAWDESCLAILFPDPSPADQKLGTTPAEPKKLEPPKQVASMSGMEYELYDVVCELVSACNDMRIAVDNLEAHAGSPAHRRQVR